MGPIKKTMTLSSKDFLYDPLFAMGKIIVQFSHPTTKLYTLMPSAINLLIM